jgi:hypothetical protein
MVDGETSVMMMAMISSNTPSREGARTEFLVLNRSFWWWQRSRTLSGKNAEPPLFLGQRPPGAAWPGPRHQVVWAHRGSSPSRLLAP